MNKFVFLTCVLTAVLPIYAHAVHFLDDQFPVRDEKKIQLGKFLMYDNILSGNKNISCATCHHPHAGLGDGLALPVGEGGVGLGL